jgi:hypothetical protein
MNYLHTKLTTSGSHSTVEKLQIHFMRPMSYNLQEINDRMKNHLLPRD